MGRIIIYSESPDETDIIKHNGIIEDEYIHMRDAPSRLYALLHKVGLKTLRGMDSKIEKYFKRDAHIAYEYAYYVLQRRWPEGEHVIMKNPYTAYLYADNVMHERWEEAEKYIFTHPYCTLSYVKCVIKERLPEAEDTLLGTEYWDAYVKLPLPVALVPYHVSRID